MKSWRPSADGWHSIDLPEPTVEDEEVLVRVSATCVLPDELRPDAERAPGGAVVGTVLSSGSAATAWTGARVLLSAVSACGECPTCRRGRAAVCPHGSILGRSSDGGCAELVTTRARWLCRLDERLPLDDTSAAIAAGPALLAYALWCRAGVGAGDVAVIRGTGPISQVLLRLAAVRGVKLADQDAEARDSGAPRKLLVCDDWLPAEALEAATPGSVLVFHGAGEGSIDLRRVGALELSVCAVPHGHPDLLPELAALIAKGEIEVASLANTGQLSPDFADEVVAAARAGRAFVVSS
jgi:threonine dehydrogenase-like Zn-dependent dehydrogenase